MGFALLLSTLGGSFFFFLFCACAPSALARESATTRDKNSAVRSRDPFRSPFKRFLRNPTMKFPLARHAFRAPNAPSNWQKNPDASSVRQRGRDAASRFTKR